MNGSELEKRGVARRRLRRSTVGSVVALALVAMLLVNVSPAAADPIVPVTVTIHHVFGSNPDLDVNGPGDYYARVRIGDNPFQTSPGNSVESADFHPEWQFTELVDAAQPIPITIELWDEDAGLDDHIDINPLDGPMNVNATLDYTTGTWTADAPGHDVGFASGNGEFEVGNELYDGWPGGLEFDISPDVNGDFDGDGIYDGIERFGIRNSDGTLAADMAALGADPCRKSLAVEIDWFEVPGDHDHKPDAAAVAEIEAAFADAPLPASGGCPYAGFPKAPTGVDLVLDVDSPIEVSATLDADGPFGLDELGATKADSANFDPDRQGIFHYNVWAHTQDGGNVSGRCCWEGTDFITSLGYWDSDLTPEVERNGTVRDQSGTFMHEFGHALGLSHGGTDGVNHKPNYLSVMSYAFQTAGIPDADLVTLADWDGDVFEQWARPDYSRTALPPLDETNLDETVGIQDGDALTRWIDPTGTVRTGRGDGGLDWDWDSPGGAGPFETPVAADVNRNKEEACVTRVDTLTTVAEGDDLVVVDSKSNPRYIFSGPDRTCDTTADGDDEQTNEVGWEQPQILVGASDWDKLTYLGPALDGEGDDVAPHDDLTYDEAQEIEQAWLEAVNRRPEADAGGPYQVVEGSTVQLDGTGSTDPNGDPISYQWSPADRLDDATSATPTYSALDDTVDQLTLTATDPQGLSGSDTATVTVTNADPVVDGTGAAIDEGGTAHVSATFTDAGSADTHTATVDWGDGTPAEVVPVTQGAGSGSLAADHAYGDNGAFPVTITVTDDDGGAGADVVAVVVANLQPSVSLDTTGSVLFPGGSAIVTEVGEAHEQVASATDPGSDDLTFDWTLGPTTTHFNDGIGPDPLPSPGGTFPFAAQDATESGFDAPGLYTLGLTVTDDDGGSAGGEIAQVVVGTAEYAYGSGWWLQNFQAKKPLVPKATLAGYLAIVRHVSSVFAEAAPLATSADAAAALSPKDDDKRALLRADILTAWLHFASGAVAWDAMVPVTANQSVPYLTVMAQVEAVALNPASTDADLLAASTLVLKTIQAN